VLTITPSQSGVSCIIDMLEYQLSLSYIVCVISWVYNYVVVIS